MAMVLPASCVMKDVADQSVQRVVLVYMAAEKFSPGPVNNNIEWMQQSIGNGMENAVMLVYVDKSGRKPCLLRVRKGRNRRDTGLDTLRKYDEMNSADPSVLRMVLDDVKREWPCDSYGLVLWSHGTGWIPKEQLKNTELGWAPVRNGAESQPDRLEFDINDQTKAFAVDESGEWMNIDELADVFGDHEFDFIAFDACYMGNVEVMYKLRNKTDYIISSSIEIWTDGFPYFKITRSLLNKNLIDVCRSFYDYYSLDYSRPMAGISLVRTSQLDSLARCFRKIVANNDTIPQMDASRVQSLDWFKNHIFYDLEDFVDKLGTEYLNEFRLQLDECVLYKNSTPYIFPGDMNKQHKIDQYCGMSVFIPLSKFDSWGLNDDYRKTEWSIDTNY